MSTREIDREGAPGPAPPDGEPVAEWEVAAIGPGWRPVPGEDELPPVAGRLALYPDALVFRADEATERGTGERIVDVVPAASVTGAGPLSPGSRATATEPLGRWMPGPLRRFRCPGFGVATTGGSWVFDSPKGVRRAEEIRRRYGA